jgi:hypothetical protein
MRITVVKSTARDAPLNRFRTLNNFCVQMPLTGVSKTCTCTVRAWNMHHTLHVGIIPNEQHATSCVYVMWSREKGCVCSVSPRQRGSLRGSHSHLQSCGDHGKRLFCVAMYVCVSCADGVLTMKRSLGEQCITRECACVYGACPLYVCLDVGASRSDYMHPCHTVYVHASSLVDGFMTFIDEILDCAPACNNPKCNPPQRARDASAPQQQLSKERHMKRRRDEPTTKDLPTAPSAY